jgi:hypothetical protein
MAQWGDVAPENKQVSNGMEMIRADGPGGLSLASHRGGQGSLRAQSIWGLWSIKWHWDSFSS